MLNEQTFLGLAQVNLSAVDVAAARDWYTSFLGIDPYFQRPDESRPAYVEFRLGAFQDELGIIDRRYLPPTTAQPSGVIARWHVADIDATMARLLDHGASEYEPVTLREAGFATASVTDPFGNILGLIHSPHFADVLSAKNG